MQNRIVLLSGRIASGKSSLAKCIADRSNFRTLSTRDLLTAHGVDLDRISLQRAGARLDRKTKGTWVRDALVRWIQKHDPPVDLVVDAVRNQAQIDAIRKAYPTQVTHVHLTANEDILHQRYEQRDGPNSEKKDYSSVSMDPTERKTEILADSADVVIDSGKCDQGDVFIRVASRLGFYPRSSEKFVDVLVGGQFGSEGKGNIASYLAPEYDVLVRVGGPNAGHTVYEEPNPYSFHTLPSGTRNSQALIVLGPGTLISVKQLLKEIADCEVSIDRLRIDPQAMIIEEWDRKKERKLAATIGSTRQGVGWATVRRILRCTGDGPKPRLASTVAELGSFIQPTIEILNRAFVKRQRVFLEGTQGTGLSLHHGNFPHVTSRDTTVAGCLAESGIPPARVRRVLMVCRSYPIRVESPEGNSSGPMKRELSWHDISNRSRIPLTELKKVERTTTTNRKRRVAEFDWEQLRRSASLNCPTDVVLTFADYIDIRNRKAQRFEQLTEETLRFVEEIQRVSGAPVSLISTRFHYRGIIDRRKW